MALDPKQISSFSASDSSTPASLGPASLATWIGWITNRIKAITGKTNWYDTPDTNLASTATHISASAPHSGHESTSNKGLANGYAALDSNSMVANSALGTGTADSTTFLRGDRTWAIPSGSGGISGPGSSTDRAIATWNSTSGNALRDNSGATISSGGDLSISGSIGPGPYTVGTLPSAASHTNRFLVATDAANAFSSRVVWSNGSNWIMGDGRVASTSTSFVSFDLVTGITAGRTISFPNASGTVGILSLQQQWTAQQRTNPTTVSVSSNTCTLDLSASNLFTTSVTANITTITLNNIAAGQSFNWLLTNTGTFTWTLPSSLSVLLPSGASSQLSSGNGKRTLLSCVTVDGTTFACSVAQEA